MLASTVQFSTSNQPPATRPHQPHAHPSGATWRYEMQTGPEQRSRHTPHADRRERWPVPSGPNSVPTTHPAPATRFHAPPGVTPY
jgi:hypothetical protein